jgi:2,3-bisphosphoglycerate-dependent phosphoglycerate mutase
MTEKSHQNGTLILIRHGKSEYNIKKRFTGWLDTKISPEGIEEAHKAAKLLKDFTFQEAYTSNLQRAQKTLQIILKDLNQNTIPTTTTEALNERHYGDWQGKNKDQVQEEIGEEEFKKARRGYETGPPNGESLKDTAERCVPYVEKEILPKLKKGKTIIIAAHGNSLRAIIMKLENLSPNEVVELNVPTGTPYVYSFNKELQITNKQILQN